VWVGVAWLAERWPDTGDAGPTALFTGCMAAVGLGLLVASLAGSRFDLPRLVQAGPRLVALGLLLGVWELASAKLVLLPRPFFATPQSLLEVYRDDWYRLCDSTLHSLALLVSGYVLGAVLGFICGVAIGWSRAIGYWVHPVLRFIGPLPATAWLPMAFFVLPSSWTAGVFLIALATGFPVAVLTWSGVASVSPTYYDVARTLGASTRFLIFRVAIPAAMPSVFVGLFMGLGASFAVLVVAEMMGVKSGLGFYLSWAQGWAAYPNMYAALLVMALMCSGLITLLFRLRDRLLSWQKGLLQW
jgi:NitT/TauT family transport system permease protein